MNLSIVSTDPTDAAPSGPSHDAVFWGFSGLSGGAGVTAMCIAVAYELVAHFRSDRRRSADQGVKVCLFDADFENGALSDYLDMTPSLSETDLQMAPDRVDPVLMRALIKPHSAGFDVVSATNRLDGNALTDPALVLAIMDSLSEMYDYVIMDVPRLWTRWTEACLLAADRFSLITELDVPSLRRFNTRVRAIEDKLGHKTDIGLILNKFERRSFRNSLKISDVKNVIGRMPDGAVCIYGDLVREAINRGVPVPAMHPDGRYARDVRDFLSAWIKEHEAVRTLKDQRLRPY